MKISEMSVELIDKMGSDLSVVNAARVSFAKESKWVNSQGEKTAQDWDILGNPVFKLSEADTKLINYLAKHKHFSPFNHAFMSFRVKAPIFVARQLVKHKFMPWNEVSRRYVDDEPEFYLPPIWRGKAKDVKQGSDQEFKHPNFAGHENLNKEISEEILAVILEAYNDLLEGGICPEQARMILPQNTMTEWIWSGSLGAFADMLKLRLDPHTQAETRRVAEKIYDIVVLNYPVSIQALLENK